MSGAEPKESIYRIDRESDGSLRYSSINHPVPSSSGKAKATSAHLIGSINHGRAWPAFPAGEAIRLSRPVPLHTAKKGQHGKEEETSALRAFGMFWKRDLVTWSGRPLLLGRKSNGTPLVNFARQTGIYLLQDGARTVYVGRAGDSLYGRLKAHTTDRLGGRWNRFSWFGLRDLCPNPSYPTKMRHWSEAMVLRTIEALLIESLEPPLNRRRGDGLCGLEYLQAIDPKVAEIRIPPWLLGSSECGLPEV